MPWLASGDAQALLLTVKLAATTTVILVALCLPLAWLLVRRDPRGRGLIQSLVMLPLVLPPTVLGYYLLVAFSPAHPPGSWLARLFDQQLAFSFSGILIGSLIYSLPFAFRPLEAALQQRGPALDEAGRVLGFPAWYRFLFIVIPGIWPALVSAALLCFAHTLGEFGVVLMIGGNIPGETRVLSVALFEHVEQMNYQAANRLALTMMAMAVVTVLLSGHRHDRF
ncbi:MAG TPA: molybdate ABC transporter permease subunit [Alcanivorax sp.]|nr:molybdate ABC transporter permease subunit [Alcanivorax sp.]